MVFNDAKLMLMNILDNAVNTPKGNKIMIEIKQDKSYFPTITIKDNGVGIGSKGSFKGCLRICQDQPIRYRPLSMVPDWVSVVKSS